MKKKKNAGESGDQQQEEKARQETGKPETGEKAEMPEAEKAGKEAEAPGAEKAGGDSADEKTGEGQSAAEKDDRKAALEEIARLNVTKKSEKKTRGKSFFHMHPVLCILLIVLIVFDAAAGSGYGYLHSKYSLLQYSEGKYGTDSTIVDETASQTSEEAAEQAKLDEETSKEINEQNANVAEAKTIEAEGDIFSDSDVYNILLIGTDDRTKKFKTNARGDTCILLSINKEKNTVHFVSFERAMGMPILKGEYKGQHDWLTHTFRYGGPYLQTEEIRECFKIDVTKFIRVNIWTFIQLVDAVGGVDIDLTEAEANNIDHPEGSYTEGYIKGMHVENEVQQDLVEGVNHLNGATAMCYARLRSIDSDWHRVERQRKVILAAIEQMKKMSVTELDSLLNKVLPMVQTNLSESDVTELITLVPEYLNAEYGQMTIPFENTYGMMTGMEGRRMFAVDFDTNARILQAVLYHGADPETLETYYEGLDQPTYYTSKSYQKEINSAGNTSSARTRSSGSSGTSGNSGTSAGTGTDTSGTSAGTSLPAGLSVDPNSGYLYDSSTGIVYDPTTGNAVGTVPDPSILTPQTGTGDAGTNAAGTDTGTADPNAAGTAQSAAADPNAAAGTDAAGGTGTVVSVPNAAAGTGDAGAGTAAGAVAPAQ